MWSRERTAGTARRFHAGPATVYHISVVFRPGSPSELVSEEHDLLDSAAGDFLCLDTPWQDNPDDPADTSACGLDPREVDGFLTKLRKLGRAVGLEGTFFICLESADTYRVLDGSDDSSARRLAYRLSDGRAIVFSPHALDELPDSHIQALASEHDVNVIYPRWQTELRLASLLFGLRDGTAGSNDFAKPDGQRLPITPYPTPWSPPTRRRPAGGGPS